MFDPVPTEYKGIVFRSKSEALVARAFDVEGGLSWLYEPQWLCDDDGWIPDFFGLFGGDEKKYFPAVIEYKPSLPTETYLKKLEKRFIKISDQYKFLCMCIYGSFYEEPYQIEFLTMHKGKLNRDGSVLFYEEVVKESLKYRFDLRGVS